MATNGPGARVRAARKAKGVGLRALAGLIGVSPATLSQIENGRTGLSVARLDDIADALHTTAARILAGTDLPASGCTEKDAGTGWRAYGPLDLDPVLAAALAEFLEVGYHGATVRDIAARAGLSVSGMYHYHASKQRMLVGILDHTMTDLLARARAARAEGRDPVERFALLVENLALFHTHRRELGFVGASEMRGLEAADRDRIARLRTAQQRLVDHEVEQAVAEGRFRADHPHEAARAVVTMCTALPTWWRPGGPSGPERIARQYVGFALDLMAPPDGRRS
ncbi:TetR family transcriptional regulator [Streptomyces sp. NPDC101175]|uniref:TetR family transcriptional regulator n=1 Tax=Streptomyces sp. NPDC101175 TaxID=3366123 RepID=UPI003836F1C4